MAAKESLIRAWAVAPWHSWIKDEPSWCDLLAEVLSRLPATAVAELLGPARPLIVLPPVDLGRITRVEAALPGGACILQLDSKLLARPRHEALGILAHELAHVCTDAAPVSAELDNDLEADRLAAAWGFAAELRQALSADLESSHPRVVAAFKTAA